MNLRKFWEYYKPVADALNKKNYEGAIKILNEMANKEGLCSRWKELMVRFVKMGGTAPDHLDTMMMLSENDDLLKEYVKYCQIRT